MNMRQLTLLCGIAAASVGCALAPEYARPAAPIPDAWPNGAPASTNAAGSATNATSDTAWRGFFTNAPLQGVIELALANNRDLRVAGLTVARTRALYQIQRSALSPTVGVAANGSRQRMPASLSQTGEEMTSEQYDVNFGFMSYELDFFGRIRSLKDQALEQYLATEQARRSAQLALVSEVAGMYLVLAADRDRLTLSRSTLDAQQASYQLILRRRDLGSASELDVRQAQTRVDAARVDIARFAGQAMQDANALNALVGATVPEDILPGAIGSAAAFKDLAPGLPSDLLVRRPDILGAENQLKAANANIGAARAAFFPRIALTAGVGTMSDQLSGLFKAGSETWGFAPKIEIPIFTAGRNRATLRAAKVDREIAVALYEKAIQGAFREVADALVARASVQDQLAAQQSLVDATAETYRLADVRYRGGIDSYLTVLDAQRSLYGAQQGLISLRLARELNALALYQALGGGWDDATVTAPPGPQP